MSAGDAFLPMCRVLRGVSGQTGRVNRTKIRAVGRWFVPPVALSNMVATVVSADGGGWSGGTVGYAVSAFCFAVMTGALWADKF